jgi:hypothetical protein
MCARGSELRRSKNTASAANFAAQAVAFLQQLSQR